MYITLFKPRFFQRKQSDLIEYRKNILVWWTKTTKVWKLHLNVAYLHDHVLSTGRGLGNSNVWVQVCTIKKIREKWSRLFKPKSQYLFHKNLPPRDFFIMTLFSTMHFNFSPIKFDLCSLILLNQVNNF